MWIVDDIKGPKVHVAIATCIERLYVIRPLDPGVNATYAQEGSKT